MDLSSVYYLALPAVLLYAGYVALRPDPLDAIPTVGATGWFSAVRNTIAFFRGGAPAMVQEGYDKYKGRAFKMARMGRWDVVVTGNKLVDEMRKAPDEYLSFSGAAHEALQTRYTMGPGIVDDEYHVPIRAGKNARSPSTDLGAVPRSASTVPSYRPAMPSAVPGQTMPSPVLAGRCSPGALDGCKAPTVPAVRSVMSGPNARPA